MEPILSYLTLNVQIIIIQVSQDKLKLLYRTTNINGNNKIFDKDLKSILDYYSAFVLEFLTPNAKMSLPK